MNFERLKVKYKPTFKSNYQYFISRNNNAKWIARAKFMIEASIYLCIMCLFLQAMVCDDKIIMTKRDP